MGDLEWVTYGAKGNFSHQTVGLSEGWAGGASSWSQIHGVRQLLDPSWTQVFVQALSCFRIGHNLTGTLENPRNAGR